MPNGLQSLYRSTIRLITPVLDRLSGDDPDRSKRVRHWFSSLAAIHDVERLSALDVPWWTYGAIEQIQEWFDGVGPDARVLEYGSGASTVWLARRAREVHSIEHDHGFGAIVEEMCLDHPNVELHIVEPVPSTDPVTPSGRRGHEGLDFDDYVRTGPRIGGRFDLIVIDGRARAECLQASADLLSPGGRIVFDNSNRPRYRGAIESSGLVERRHHGLTPSLPYPEHTSVLSSASAPPL